MFAPRRQAQIRLLPRHRRLALHGDQPGDREAASGSPTISCSTSTTRRSSTWRTGRRAEDMRDKFLRALDRVAAELAGDQVGMTDQVCRPGARGARDSARGHLSRRHRLRPRDAALLQGAHPLGDPLPRTGRPHDVSRDPHRARHRRPGHQGDPGRRQRHRRELPDERPLRRRLRPLSRLHRRRDEHGPARTRARWR